MKLGKNRGLDAKVELQIAPLIDVVFLLLIYFMVTASLIKKEADISFMLPANVPPEKIMELPVEALIFVSADGTVELDGIRFPAEDLMLDDLVAQLMGLKDIAASQTSLPLVVTITPSSETLHMRIVEVMDACAAAGVKSLSFGKSI